MTFAFISKKFRVLVFCGWTVLLSGCSSLMFYQASEPKSEVVIHEKLGEELFSILKSKIALKQDPEILQYLHTLGESLAQGTDELQKIPIHIELLQDVNQKWQSYSLPGHKIFLSTGLLKRAQYENEIAAVLAIQFGHILNNNMVKRFWELENENRSSRGPYRKMASYPLRSLEDVQEFFQFSEAHDVSAFRTGVDVLYRAGYDVRGLVSICDIFNKNQKYSPYSSDRISELLENVRHEIAMYPPLRNPIIKSHKFISVQKRIQRL